MISKEEMEGLAGLARLTLGDAEMEALGKEISSILEYMGQINTFDASSTKATVPLQRNVLREDVIRTESDTMTHKEEAILSQFPRREGNYNVVKKIIQKDE